MTRRRDKMSDVSQPNICTILLREISLLQGFFQNYTSLLKMYFRYKSTSDSIYTTKGLVTEVVSKL